nr:septum formation initiator family protein [Alistipes sp.]
EQLEKKISTDSAFIHQLNTSPDFLEKVAREQYHMQREGETVYILE